MREIAKNLTVSIIGSVAGTWLRGLITAMVLGALAGGAVYVSPKEGGEVKAGIEAGVAESGIIKPVQ